MVNLLGTFFLFIYMVSGAEGFPEQNYPQTVGILKSGLLIQELLPDWYLSPKVFGNRNEKGEIYFRDGEAHPKGKQNGDFALLLSPSLSKDKSSPSRPSFWSVCLIEEEHKVRWKKTTRQPLGWTIAPNGNSAIVGYLIDGSLGIRILDREGKCHFCEAWLNPVPLYRQPGDPWLKVGVLRFSPKGQYFVYSITPFNSEGPMALPTISVVDCVTGEKWETSVEGSYVSHLRFVDEHMVRLFLRGLSTEEMNRMIDPGDELDSVLLDLKTGVLGKL